MTEPYDAVRTGENEKQQRILTAVLHLLTRHGIGGVSIRAVATEANVALGLVNYYFKDKHNLISAALRRIEEFDNLLVEPNSKLDAEAQLIAALRRIASPEFTNPDYLMLRIQLWSLAQVHKDFAEINTINHNHYREGLSRLIREARPSLTRSEAQKRADDIILIQQGLWLTVFLGLGQASVARVLKRTEDIALAS